MAELAGFPYFEVAVHQAGRACSTRRETQAVLNAVRGRQLDDAVRRRARLEQRHGGGARPLSRACSATCGARSTTAARRRSPAAGSACSGVLWPSKKFAEEELIPGGGAEPRRRRRRPRRCSASSTSSRAPSMQPDEAVLEQAKALVPELEAEPSGATPVRRSGALGAARARGHRRRRVGHVLRAARRRRSSRLLEPPILPGPARRRRRRRRWRHRSRRRRPRGLRPMGGAAGIGDFFSGIGAAARRLLNYATYYQMKERAGQVGARRPATRCCAICARPPEPAASIWSATASAAGWSPRPRSGRAGSASDRAGEHDAAAGGVLAQRLRRATSTATATASSARW